jgi:hypothetical protein
VLPIAQQAAMPSLGAVRAGELRRSAAQEAIFLKTLME